MQRGDGLLFGAGVRPHVPLPLVDHHHVTADNEHERAADDEHVVDHVDDGTMRPPRRSLHDHRGLLFRDGRLLQHERRPRDGILRRAALSKPRWFLCRARDRRRSPGGIIPSWREGDPEKGSRGKRRSRRRRGRTVGSAGNALGYISNGKELGGSALRFLTAAIVAGGRCDVRVTGDGRHRRDIGARVEQIRYERPAKVVRAEACDARLSKTGPVGAHASVTVRSAHRAERRCGPADCVSLLSALRHDCVTSSLRVI